MNQYLLPHIKVLEPNQAMIQDINYQIQYNKKFLYPPLMSNIKAKSYLNLNESLNKITNKINIKKKEENKEKNIKIIRVKNKIKNQDDSKCVVKTHEFLKYMEKKQNPIIFPKIFQKNEKYKKNFNVIYFYFLTLNKFLENFSEFKS